MKLEGASQVIKHKGQSEQTHYSPLQNVTRAVLSKSQHISKNIITMKICDAFLFLSLLVRKAMRISCMEGARRETTCINGGSKRQRQKSYNKIHSVFVRISLSPHSATNHTKQNTPVKLLSRGCRGWDKREEDTAASPHWGDDHNQIVVK